MASNLHNIIRNKNKQTKWLPHNQLIESVKTTSMYNEGT